MSAQPKGNPEREQAEREPADRERFSREIHPLNMMPLWERTLGLKPGTPCVPAHWRYSEVKPHLLAASKLITKREAERRVLVLENPSLRGTTFITQSLYAGLQIILPGEIARSHRHTPNALRFIVEGTGAYTAVEGEKVPMHPGDFIATPNWTWHDHGHEGTEPVVWMDGLDTPFTNFFGSTFREDHPEEKQEITQAAGAAAALYGSNMMPVDYARAATCPLLVWPYEKSREALSHAARNGDPHEAQGYRLRYADPATGRHPFPTIAVFLQWLPNGFAGTACRSTDGLVFNVVEGNAVVEIGKEKYAVGPHDVFVVPPWERYRLTATPECVLFSYSDRAAQETLGFWREKSEH
jgi:gentisate 1,2-dioxygenase